MNKHDTKLWIRRFRGREKERLDKELILMMKERSRLLRAKWNAPLVELKEPFQRGWVRFFALSSKAKHKKDAKRLEELLGYLNTRQYSRRRDFCVRQGKSKRWIPMNHKLPRFHVHEILRRRVPDRLFRYLINFKFEPLRDRQNAEKLRRMGYPWKFGVYDPSLFERVVEPNWITHQKVVMPEVESRLSEIEAYLDSNCGWQRYNSLRGHRSWRFCDDQPRMDELRIREYEKEWRSLAPFESEKENEGTDYSVPFSLPPLRVKERSKPLRDTPFSSPKLSVPNSMRLGRRSNHLSRAA